MYNHTTENTQWDGNKMQAKKKYAKLKDIKQFSLKTVSE